jgi:peptidoglycan hydrolase-like protein with peptidoglycan-binding domain
MLLQLGAKGDAVRRLQILLNDNLRPGTRLQVDAHFGARTEAAVLEFQVLKNIEADGVVGLKPGRRSGSGRPTRRRLKSSMPSAPRGSRSRRLKTESRSTVFPSSTISASWNTTRRRR